MVFFCPIVRKAFLQSLDSESLDSESLDSKSLFSKPDLAEMGAWFLNDSIRSTNDARWSSTGTVLVIY